MTGFWYPYRDFAEASDRLGRFVDRAIGRSCGISYSDGVSVAVVRPALGGHSGLWLNVLRQNVAVPSRPAPAPQGRWQKMELWFENLLSTIGENEIRRSEAELAASRATLNLLHDDVWLPAHQFLLRHKLIADGVAVALDVIGVIAGVAFVVAAAPEILGGAAIIGTVGLITGGAATAGSVILFGIDGSVFGAEVTGHEAAAKMIEDNENVQWARIVATVMVLPDMAVGGPRALREIGAIGREADEARDAARGYDSASEAQRARQAKIRNPEKHPAPVQRHAHRARVLARQAEESRADVLRLHRRMTLLTIRDANASFVASPGSAGLLAGLPPALMESHEDLERDEKLLASLLAPERGMPADAKLSLRTSGVSRMKKP